VTRTKRLYRPFRFFLIEFLLTWVPLWLAVAGIKKGWFEFNAIFMAVAGISAVPAALIMIYTSGNRELVRDFWRRAINPVLIPCLWWAVTLLFVPILMSLSVFLSLAFGGSLSQPVPLFFYLAGMIPQAVIMNWIYFHTNRSVLSAVFFHFLVNFVGEAFHISQLSKSIGGAFYYAAAILILIIDRVTFFRLHYPIGLEQRHGENEVQV
jgi:hypothetical protein